MIGITVSFLVWRHDRVEMVHISRGGVGPVVSTKAIIWVIKKNIAIYLRIFSICWNRKKMRQVKEGGAQRHVVRISWKYDI